MSVERTWASRVVVSDADFKVKTPNRLFALLTCPLPPQPVHPTGRVGGSANERNPPHSATIPGAAADGFWCAFPLPALRPPPSI